MIHKNTRVVSEKSGDILRAAVLGEIDHHGAAGLRDELDELICASRPKKVELDLSKVDFMDSSGLGIIMGRHATAEKIGAALVLKNPAPRVARIIELSGLNRMIPIEYQNGGGSDNEK